MATVTRTPFAPKPKVKKVSDRKFYIVTNGPVVEGPPGSECSKEPASPCQTTALLPVIPKFSDAYISQRHPSVEIIGARLRECKDVAQFRALAAVFSTTINTNILHSFDQLPFVDAEDDEYRTRRFFITDACRQFKEQTTASSTKSGSAIEKSLVLLELIFEALNDLVHIAEQLFNAGKPLPQLPESQGDDEDGGSAESPTGSPESPTSTLVDAETNEPKEWRKSLSVIVEEVLAEAATQGPTTPNSVSLSASDASSDKKVHFAAGDTSPDSGCSRLPNLYGKSTLGHKLHILHQVVQRSKSSMTLRSFSSSTTVSPPIELELEEQVPWKSQESLRSIRMPYSLRQSCLYQFLDDEERVDMPMPKVDDMLTDNDGRVMEASVEALVVQLTSNAVLDKPELLFFFFNTFRYYCSPELLAEKLQERFEDKAPTDLTPDQVRIWWRSNKGNKFRVRNFVQTWVHSYWTMESDERALSPLISMSLHSLTSLDDGSTIRLFSHLLGAAKGFKSRRSYLKTLRDMISQGSLIPTPPPTGSKLAAGFTTVMGMKSFMGNESNRQELARQITVRSAMLYSQIDCDDAVRAWFKGEPMTLDVLEAVNLVGDWSRRLAFFVTHTILSEGSTGTKKATVEFWLDIAMDCLHHGNLDGAMAVFSGITTIAITRLKKVILGVSANHKYIYRVIHKLFFADSNFRHYRQVLSGLREKVVPHVPLLDPFKKDLSGAQAVCDLSAKKGDHLIKLGPYHTVHNTIEAMESAQIDYKFQSSPSIQIWLDKSITPCGGADFAEKLYEQSIQQYPKNTDPEYSSIDPWQFTLPGKKLEPVVPLRIDLDKILAINRDDPDPIRSKERRRALAMYKVSIIPTVEQ